MSTNRLGELLVREKLISLQQLRQAQEEQRKSGSKLGYALAKLGYISDGEITNFLSSQYRVPSIDLNSVDIDEDLTKLIPREVCERHIIVPVVRVSSAVTVAMADPTNLNAIDDIKFLTGYNVDVVVASETAILETIERIYSASPDYEDVLADFDEGDIDFSMTDDDINVLELEKEAAGAPVVRLVNAILLSAIQKGASDIHIEPYEKSYRVRFRIDGVLYEIMNPPMKLKEAIASRLKILAKLDIAEKRLPQDGRIKIKMKYQGKLKELDYRVSTLPTLHGEKIVMRLLDKDNIKVGVRQLGLSKQNYDTFQSLIRRPNGIFLVTGPTGSGKTTTLYSALSEINTPVLNILTVEAPVEFQLAGISQVQVNAKIDLTFARGLRAFLRHDPDVIMVGETRDEETANTVIEAALTGHLVFSTLHTNSATQTVDRVLDAFPADQQNQVRAQLAQVLKGVVSMKLVERSDGEGLTAALEIMKVSPRVAQLVEKGETSQLLEEVESSVGYYRMQSMNQSLLALLVHQKINYQDAMEFSTDPEDLSLKLRKMFPEIEDRVRKGGKEMPSYADFSQITELMDIKKLYEEQEEKFRLRIMEKDQEIENLRQDFDWKLQQAQENAGSSAEVEAEMNRLRGENERLRQEAQQKINQLQERIKELNQKLMGKK